METIVSCSDWKLVKLEPYNTLVRHNEMRITHIYGRYGVNDRSLNCRIEREQYAEICSIEKSFSIVPSKSPIDNS